MTQFHLKPRTTRQSHPDQAQHRQTAGSLGRGCLVVLTLDTTNSLPPVPSDPVGWERSDGMSGPVNGYGLTR